MIKAGSLLYAVLISLILALICSAFIAAHFLQDIAERKYEIKNQLTADAHSAINYYIYASGEAPVDQTFHLYPNSEIESELHVEKWGLLSIVTARARLGSSAEVRSALVGEDLNRDTMPALYLADNSIPLVVCGRTSINGHCFLPKSGFKRGYIEGENTGIAKPVNGKIEVSTSTLPVISVSAISAIDSALGQSLPCCDSTAPDLPAASTRSFDSSMLVYSFIGEIDIDNITLDGKIAIVSSKMIKVGSHASLHDVILRAPYVLVESNFEGNCQIFATDSIHIQRGVSLSYPSMVCMRSDENTISKPRVQIDEHAKVAGAVLLIKAYDPINKTINLSVSRRAMITGLVYCDGIADMQGNVIGSLVCINVAAQTNTGFYLNYLLNSTISSRAMPDHMAAVSLGTATPIRRLIKWL
ncbi:MAG: hypothetical protein JST83_10060 [Bacteroidetes bacterium]|nr:hypothetical protein [Bacteroidota bacterium]